MRLTFFAVAGTIPAGVTMHHNDNEDDVTVPVNTTEPQTTPPRFPVESDKHSTSTPNQPETGSKVPAEAITGGWW